MNCNKAVLSISLQRGSCRRQRLKLFCWRKAFQHRTCAHEILREGFAAIPSVRKSSGKHAAEWIKKTMEEYYTNKPDVHYRSDAAWSLRQMDDRFSILRPDTVVIDLGCFSGGWSQVAVERTQVASSSSKVIGVDIVQMDPIEHHTFISADIADDSTIERLRQEMGDRMADVVLSDVCPPTVGLKQEDHLASAQSSLHSAKIMEKTLRLGGWFVVKLLYGCESFHYRVYLNSRFEFVRTIRPPASRGVYREMFYICRGFIGRQSIAEEVVLGTFTDKREGMDDWDVNMRRR